MRKSAFQRNVLWAVLLFAYQVLADEHSHSYTHGEEVVVWMNTVGPVSNIQETYDYYQLPFCRGQAEVEHHHETLGEALQGMDLINSGIRIRYNQPAEEAALCEAAYGNKEINLFTYAVKNSYMYQMYIDDLPIYGNVGEYDKSTDQAYLFTHQDFTFAYNGDRIIHVELKTGNKVALNTDATPLNIQFTYTVKWTPTDKPFDKRFESYLDADFFEHKIHWFSILNSFLMVLFLSGLVSVILLRTLRRDYARYDKEEGFGDLDHDLGDDYGWKQVHGDVFRSPPQLMAFSALVGTGNQLVVLVFFVILYTIIGDSYAERATILTATIFLYALTSGLAGYRSASIYAQYGGKDWIKNMLLTALLWPAMVSIVTAFINSVAIYYSSSRAIAFTVMLAMLAIWLFLCFPLTLLGAILGKNWAGQPNFPCRVNPIPRPIPEKNCLTEPLVIIAMGGILPFGSIFIEMYFIFTSFWAYKIYYVYGFMLLVFAILLIVTACVTLVSTYFLLNSEDHRWHWMSFLTCGSTSVYVFLYSIYYFFQRTRMHGLFQTSFYFGYTGLACFGLFCILGFVGHMSANYFVRRIYHNVKLD
ncbi:hypothetical protein BZG36_00936 [Bifiguratus adelaidae]|uniref:Transmembrane 9 superfamily member n=1 Tax=Bifiguratus adelaidae TaxID=1938954 RepID=A0A261Y5W4_9FUNG|nr:hypothetical protein BZG36_00936 [Bifiguratus adelaidae]